jgi:hypothetical protein
MSAVSFYFGIAQLAIVFAALGYVALRLRKHLLPGWDEAAGYLVTAVTGIGLLVVLSELLGVFGLFRGWALVVGSLMLAAIAWRYLQPRPNPKVSPDAPEGDAEISKPPRPRVAAHGYWLALLTTAVLVAQWAAFTSYSLDAGISNFDSVWYHLPFSADLFQTGSTLSFYKTETVFTNWFYPQNSELVHAVGMALTGKDFFSVMVNMGWLALALLAAWCIGRPYARPHLTLIAASILLATHTIVVREPGTAKNDIVGIALILSALAILVNRGADPSDTRGRLGPGWAMAAAGLAAGLAVGTKVTVMAPVAMMTFAVLFSAHHGTRLRSAAVWFGSGLVGGGFWYLRNLLATGNPIPQVESIGPIDLPGPDRLQQGRADFSVFHYITDSEIWSSFFFPGLERGFGELWPVLLAVAIIGLVALIFRGPGRLTRAHGFAALLAIAAYLFTPLGAAGPEGSPDAFSINLRFLVPALSMALVLIPLLPWFARPRPQLAFAFVLLTLFFTDGRGDAIWSQSGRYFGIAFALAFVVAPAIIWHYRVRLGLGSRDHPESGENQARRFSFGALAGRRERLLAGIAGATVVAGLLVAWPLADGYFDSRYTDFEPETGLAEPYRWANGVEDAEIGLAGSSAGFRQYGFFGEDLSNRLTFIGEEASAGGFDVIMTCPEFRQAVNEAELDYLVTSPFLNFNGDRKAIPSPEGAWVADDPALSREVGPGPVEVWRVEGSLDPAACDPSAPGPEATPGLVDG